MGQIESNLTYLYPIMLKLGMNYALVHMNQPEKISTSAELDSPWGLSEPKESQAH